MRTRQIALGPQCGPERPGFAQCVAKAVAADEERVYVVGHLTRTNSRSDFAVVAFLARTSAHVAISRIASVRM